MKQYNSVFLLSTILLINSAEEFSEEQIKKICFEVKLRDDVLVKDFTNLLFKDRNKVFPHMKNYIDTLEEFVKCYENNPDVTADICKDVIEEGGPKYLNLPYDLDVIQAKFNWTEEETEELYSLRKRTLDVWWDLDNLLPADNYVEMTSRTTWF